MTMIKTVEREDGIKHQVYGYRRGKKVYVGTFDTNKQAEHAQEEFRVNTRRIERGELAEGHDERMALSDALTKWLAMLETSKARSHKAYSDFVRLLIEPKLGKTPVAQLAKKHVEKWRDSLVGKYAATSINSAITALSSACGWFVDQRWIETNPCHGVKRLKVPPRAYNWVRTRAEFERLLLTCSDELRDMVGFSVGTMLRIDEMLHLQWDDIDLANRLITVQRGRKGPPKNGKIRHVPILDSVLPILQRRALKRGGALLVFPSPKGAVRTQAPCGTMLKGALARSGLDTAIRWHDLRHTGASWWVMSGGDIFRLSKLLGHSDVKITRDTYAHLAPEAWQQDYARVAFRVPSEPAKIVELVHRDGKLVGTATLTVDARKMPPVAERKRA